MFSGVTCWVCRTVLNKKARKRPSATVLLEHPWVVKNMAQEVLAPARRPHIERLLDPIPIYHITSPDTEAEEQELASKVSDVPPGTAGSLQTDNSIGTPRSPDTPLRHLGGRGAVSFAVPPENITGVCIHQLSPEEKGETGAAVGMKARLQLYMNRQRL